VPIISKPAGAARFSIQVAGDPWRDVLHCSLPVASDWLSSSTVPQCCPRLAASGGDRTEASLTALAAEPMYYNGICSDRNGRPVKALWVGRPKFISGPNSSSLPPDRSCHSRDPLTDQTPPSNLHPTLGPPSSMSYQPWTSAPQSNVSTS
jgi:hypothetical protein